MSACYSLNGRLLSTAAIGAVLAAWLSAGCAAGPDRRLLDLEAQQPLARFVHEMRGRSPDMCCQAHGRYSACERDYRSCGAEPFGAYIDYDVEHFVAAGGTMEVGSGCSCAGDTCRRRGGTCSYPEEIWLAVARAPGVIVGTIVHACLPAVGPGPPVPPPPSRFHPVPTGPVFAPRERASYSMRAKP